MIQWAGMQSGYLCGNSEQFYLGKWSKAFAFLRDRACIFAIVRTGRSRKDLLSATLHGLNLLMRFPQTRKGVVRIMRTSVGAQRGVFIRVELGMRTGLSHWWRSFFSIGDEARRTALDVLRERYVDETEHEKRFTQHARQMHYPQYRETLLHIAAEEAEHAGLLAKKIIELGGKLPEVTGERASTEQSSWQHLLEDLNEEGHCAGELMEQTWAVATDYPDIAMLLEQISRGEKKHRDEIRKMLMRSDPFAGSLA
jgi:rubrerythrin